MCRPWPPLPAKDPEQETCAVAQADNGKRHGRPGETSTKHQKPILGRQVPSPARTRFVGQAWSCKYPMRVQRMCRRDRPRPGHRQRELGELAASVWRSSTRRQPCLEPRSESFSLMKLTSTLGALQQARAPSPRETRAVEGLRTGAAPKPRVAGPLGQPATVVPTSMAMAEVGPRDQLSRGAEERNSRGTRPGSNKCKLRRAHPSERTRTPMRRNP